MLQLSQILLPVDHSDADLRNAVLKLLRIRQEDVISLKVKQRAIDARRGHVEFSFTLLVEVKEEAKVVRRMGKNPHVQPAADETYRQIAENVVRT